MNGLNSHVHAANLIKELLIEKGAHISNSTLWACPGIKDGRTIKALTPTGNILVIECANNIIGFIVNNQMHGPYSLEDPKSLDGIIQALGQELSL